MRDIGTRTARWFVVGTVIAGSFAVVGGASAAHGVDATKADLHLTGSAPATVPSGGQFSYTYTVANAGPKRATNVRFTDTLTGGITYGFGSNGCTAVGSRVTCRLGRIAAGRSVVVTITVDAGARGTTRNRARVTATTVDITPADARTTVKVKIV